MDPAFGDRLAGPTNEELIAKQAELDALRAAKGYPKVEVGLSQEEKDLDSWGDLDFDPLGLRDPLEAIKRQYQKPGFAIKLLSNSVNQRLGTRDYRIVKDANGDPVRFGTMVVGEIPQRIADKRKQAVVDLSNEELRAINDETQQNIEKLKSEAKGLGLELMRPGDIVRSQKGDYEMGISVERGPGPSSSD
jgi:hypothetical protein